MGYQFTIEELLALRHRIVVSLLAERPPESRAHMEQLAKYLVLGLERDEEPWEGARPSMREALREAETAYSNAIRLGESIDEARRHALTFAHMTLAGEVERYLESEPSGPGN